MSLDIFTKIAELKKKNQTFCIVTVVDSKGATPRKAGARGLVFPDGSIIGTVGGGSIEVEAVEEAIRVLKAGEPHLKLYQLKDLKNKMSCGGSMTLYYEPVYPQRRATIFGGGHVGRAIAHITHVAGWQTRVVDHRRDVLKPKFFPDGTELIVSEYPEYIEAQQFDSNDWIIIVTPQHRFDRQVLEKMLRHEVAYLGMMGSEAKVNETMNYLKKAGISEDRLSRVRAPIGLNIGTETPGEIAVSIVAEMQAVLHGIAEVRSCAKFS